MKWRYRINAYYAILLITIAGGLATITIVHVGTTNISLQQHNSEAAYASLQQSILNSEYSSPSAHRATTTHTTP